MELTANQIATKREIGKKDGSPVFELMTKGGLYLIMGLNKNKKPETLGVGSHRAIARHIASTKAEIEWNELSKAESWEMPAFKELLPKYEQLTNVIRDGEK